jgi:hypothetical protein
MRRALRCDGLIPNLKTPDGQFAEVKPDDIRAMRAYIDANRTLTTPFDITCEGNTIGMSQAQMRDRLAPYAEAGATWWLESPFGKTEDEILKRLRQSPPNL